ncbi:HAMP domain-containing protein [Leeia sp. TBRC 13508]|uniref:histidine kinase n=1 Tax=Leeia speluncae TaxID=2884804 RepID=A0ABS8D7L6_9NEIS|nr:ATP-binding protein [Leeia speluncae]MCB6184201.1 HAMP domain-containing protein [Leeia speluncae]
MKPVGLYRLITLTMMAMAVGVTFFVVLTSYALYFFWSKYWPENFPEDGLTPTGPEWIWLIMTTLAALVLAIFVAANLSRRILAPLTSVIDGIRKVAQGDLTVRAAGNDHSLLEASQLVEDFNLLVEKLQHMTEEQAFWNAAIAHELRTPVTILRGRLQGLAEGIFPPDAKQFDSLLLQVEGLTQLIEDLRVVSLAESGHLSLSQRWVDLASEIYPLVESITPSLSKAEQQVVYDLQVKEVFCDPAKIRQAILALLENATKHAIPGTIVIRMRLENGSYLLSVSDEGPGISETFIPYVFTAFRRAPNAKGTGSGLGLAVVAAIASAHGGKASYRISSTNGSVFEICIPEKT